MQLYLLSYEIEFFVATKIKKGEISYDKTRKKRRQKEEKIFFYHLTL